MGLFKFIFSKTFLIQLVLAFLAIIVIAFLTLKWLKISTNHDERIEVPNLSMLSLGAVEGKLDEMHLQYEIMDSANYNPDYPKYAVIDQVPAPGKFVKENRKLYLTLNPSGFRKIVLPDMIRRTRRQVEPTLRSLGFEIWDVTYKPDIAKDEVMDSANYNPDYPRYAVIDQVPAPGKFVKENRKLYLTLNPSGYRKISVPDLVRRTRRQVEPTLRSLGFEIGSVTYKPDIAKDAVLELLHKGKLIEPGDELMKTSVIDLVLGDGSGQYGGDLNEADTLQVDENENETGNDDEF